MCLRRHRRDRSDFHIISVLLPRHDCLVVCKCYRKPFAGNFHTCYSYFFICLHISLVWHHHTKLLQRHWKAASSNHHFGMHGIRIPRHTPRCSLEFEARRHLAQFCRGYSTCRNSFCYPFGSIDERNQKARKRNQIKKSADAFHLRILLLFIFPFFHRFVGILLFENATTEKEDCIYQPQNEENRASDNRIGK